MAGDPPNYGTGTSNPFGGNRLTNQQRRIEAARKKWKEAGGDAFCVGILALFLGACGLIAFTVTQIVDRTHLDRTVEAVVEAIETAPESSSETHPHSHAGLPASACIMEPIPLDTNVMPECRVLKRVIEMKCGDSGYVDFHDVVIDKERFIYLKLFAPVSPHLTEFRRLKITRLDDGFHLDFKQVPDNVFYVAYDVNYENEYRLVKNITNVDPSRVVDIADEIELSAADEKELFIPPYELP